MMNKNKNVAWKDGQTGQCLSVGCSHKTNDSPVVNKRLPSFNVSAVKRSVKSKIRQTGAIYIEDLTVSDQNVRKSRTSA